MAKDAIETVKDAEEKAKTLLQDAILTSKNSKQEAETLAEQEYKKILANAKNEAEEIKRLAVQEGESIAKPIIERGIESAKALNDLKDEKLDSAVNIIIERIVNANGNS
ncbi:MAG: ATPase [Lutispora sp.]|nr:ATPase [Lutispora sp.]MDD4833758.1 ATPase [Lutispora sp.]